MVRHPSHFRARVGWFRRLVWAAASGVLVLAGCGGSSSSHQTPAPEWPTAAAPEAAEARAAAPATAPEAEPEAPSTPEAEPELPSTPEAEAPSTPEPEPELPSTPEAEPETESEAPVHQEGVPEAAWGTVSDLIHAATGADAVRFGQPPFAFTFGTEMSHYTSTTQTFAGLRYAVALPWRDDDGDLNLTFSALSTAPPGGLAPVSIHGRFVDTTGDTRPAVVQHDLKDDWSVLKASAEYSDAGTLTVFGATDAHDDRMLDVLERPVVGYGSFEHHIELSGIPGLPAGQDWQGVFITDSLAGYLDGVPGAFTAPDSSKCLPVVGCYMELNRNAASSGYFPRGSVLFTPDDPDNPATTLPDTWTVPPLPRVNTLAFGDWLYVPEEVASSHDYDFGVFGGGGDPYSSSVDDVDGIFTYAGSASGRCFAGRSSARPRVGRFEADVTLTVAADDAATLSGRVENLRLDAACSGLLTGLQLESAIIDPHSLGVAAAAGVAADEQSGSAWAGQWRAAFYGNGENPAQAPTGVAGTFGMSADDLGLAGSFGAHRLNPPARAAPGGGSDG